MLTADALSKTFRAVNRKSRKTRAVTSVYCCDLLSAVMGNCPEDAAWVTVMNNLNVIAVASLADISCIVFAEGSLPDEEMIARAEEHDIALFCSEGAVFETALKIHEQLSV